MNFTKIIEKMFDAYFNFTPFIITAFPISLILNIILFILLIV